MCRKQSKLTNLLSRSDFSYNKHNWRGDRVSNAIKNIVRTQLQCSAVPIFMIMNEDDPIFKRLSIWNFSIKSGQRNLLKYKRQMRRLKAQVNNAQILPK